MTTTDLQDAEKISRISAELADLWAPPLQVHPADWADAHGWLPAASSALPGRWRTFAYQLEIFAAWLDPHVREITLCWGTQLGKTAIGIELLSYAADCDPGPALIGCADQDSARSFSRTKLYPALDACERTARYLLPPWSRTEFFIDLRRMHVHFAWSGSPTKLGEKTIRYVLCTELDKWSTSTSSEADPELLASERVKAVPNHKFFKESTPSLRVSSRIWRDYERGTRERYHVPCPHCGAFQPLDLGANEPGQPGLHWSPAAEDARGAASEIARSTAWYECAHCHGRITDRHKPAMLRAGVWCPEGLTVQPGGALSAPRPRSRRRSFQLSSFYSPFLGFGDVAEAYVLALAAGRDGLRNFTNSWLALPWEEAHDAPQWAEVRDRLRTPRPRGLVPADAVALTAGVDIQSDRVYAAVVSVAPERRLAAVEWGEYDDLEHMRDELLVQSWPRETDPDDTLDPLAVAIDTGYRPQYVYDFASDLPRYGLAARALPVKGNPSLGAKWKIGRPETSRSGKPRRRGHKLYNIHVNLYKAELYHALRTLQPGEPGALALPSDVTEDFIRQLCGEALRAGKDRRGYDVEEWYVIDPLIGNHYLDCCIYAIWAADYLGLLKLGAPAGPSVRGGGGRIRRTNFAERQSKRREN